MMRLKGKLFNAFNVGDLDNPVTLQSIKDRSEAIDKEKATELSYKKQHLFLEDVERQVIEHSEPSMIKHSKRIKEDKEYARGFIEKGQCVDLNGNCEPDERCYCREELDK